MKKKHAAKKLAALAGVLGLSCMLCACGGQKTSTEKADIDLSHYPINTDVTLSYWVALNANISSSVANMGDTEFSKKLEENTGVHINYIHPAQGQETEALNLMIASNNLADIIETRWTTAISGGPEAAVNNQLIIPLNDLFEDYAPNLTAYLDENPDVARYIRSDSGMYYAFPFIRSSQMLLMTQGPVARADWMDELGIETPATVEDWEKMLIAFRDKKNAAAPLSLRAGARASLLGTVGASAGFYLDNGTVKFGPLEKEFRTAMETLNRWYSEGLLDKNYTMVDTSILDSNMLNNLSGATYASGGQDMGKWLESTKDKNFDLQPLPQPLTADGKKNKFSLISHPYIGDSAAISAKCQYPELAAKYLDYLYGEEGHMLANFGIEGVSYTMKDGYPTYTDLIMDNPDGLPVSQAMSLYIRGNMTGPFIQDQRYIEQYYHLPRQQEALKVWTQAGDEAFAALMPPLTPTAEEATEYSNIINDINKYCDESISAFVSGTRPLSELDSFVETLKSMRIERAIEIQQAGYDRYLKR